MRSRGLCVALWLLTVVLIGTVVVLSSAVMVFGVDLRDVVTEEEMRFYEAFLEQEEDEPLPELVYPSYHADSLRKREDVTAPVQRVPKIVHQTWKVDELPDKWEHVRQQCMQLHPDYEYKLWSDESSRQFLAAEYPWFLDTFENYPYPIQRADAIRYFVLHHYGGVYMDLDIGCQRPMDPLLYFPVLLPATVPVGVSNDLMLAEKGHPFMTLVINSLIPFNHQYGTNYPTVMFSTGPMFLSAQYGRWPRVKGVMSEVRILPRRWYGKNAPLEERAQAIFAHYYGSSWHSNDAWLITFLGKFGMALMYAGLATVIIGALKLIWSKRIPAPIIHHPFPYPSGADSLPYTRPSTPPSKIGSPFLYAIQDIQSSDSPPSNGIASFLPSWLRSSEPTVVLPVHSRPSSPTMWRNSIEIKNENRYRAISSRPSSPPPSNGNGNGHARGHSSGSGEDEKHLSVTPSSRSTSRPFSYNAHSRSPSPPPGATASLLHSANSNRLSDWSSTLFRNRSSETQKRETPTKRTISDPHTKPKPKPTPIDTNPFFTQQSDEAGREGVGSPESNSSFRYPLPRCDPVDVGLREPFLSRLLLSPLLASPASLLPRQGEGEEEQSEDDLMGFD